MIDDEAVVEKIQEIFSDIAAIDLLLVLQFRGGGNPAESYCITIDKIKTYQIMGLKSLLFMLQ